MSVTCKTPSFYEPTKERVFTQYFYQIKTVYFYNTKKQWVTIMNETHALWLMRVTRISKTSLPSTIYMPHSIALGISSCFCLGLLPSLVTANIHNPHHIHHLLTSQTTSHLPPWHHVIISHNSALFQITTMSQHCPSLSYSFDILLVALAIYFFDVPASIVGLTCGTSIKALNITNRGSPCFWSKLYKHQPQSFQATWHSIVVIIQVIANVDTMYQWCCCLHGSNFKQLLLLAGILGKVLTFYYQLWYLTVYIHPLPWNSFIPFSPFGGSVSWPFWEYNKSQW